MNTNPVDPAKPLAPLSPETVKHLTARLGPAEPCLVTRQGYLDIHVQAWLIGCGETRADTGTGEVQRGTTVEIRLTVGGNLVTTRCAWTRTADGSSEDSQTGQVHSTPHLAYEWLIKDGKGKLGPASKDAWVQACRNVPTMSGLEYERVE